MSIYDNENSLGEASPKRSKKPNIKVDTSKVLNDKTLTAIVKQMDNKLKTGKEILYDMNDNILGVLQRNNEPYFFTADEVKEFTQLIKR